MLSPHQFQVNEVWIAFQLNSEAIETKRDGSFNCVCLMDAASGFILADALVPIGEPEPSELEVRRLLKASWAHKRQFPKELLLAQGEFDTILPAEARRKGILVVRVPEDQLRVFIDDARQGFREHVQERAR